MLFYSNKKYAKHHLDTFSQLLKSTPVYSRKASKTRKLNKKNLKLINALAKITQT